LPVLAAAMPVQGQCDPQGLAKLIASDFAATDFFGSSVSISGDTVVIGARNNDHAGGVNAGAAYVFRRVGGVWIQEQKLTSSDASTADYFGFSVAVCGDTAVVGAYQDDHAGGPNAGSAYVFTRNGTVWTQQARLSAADAAVGDEFGNSVAVSGDTAVVGARIDDHAGGNEAGSAYVFVRQGGVWTQQQKLTASDAASSDFFGRSVAVLGDTAVVGAVTDDHTGGTDAGSAYVFTRKGGVWTQEQKLIASDAAANDLFGVSVALFGDTVVVGAVYNDHAGNTNAGSAYVFSRLGGVWTEQQKLTASDAQTEDQFGTSVAISGDTALVGALLDNNPGGVNAGSAYLFTRSGGVWTQQQKLTPSDASAGDQFGISVALSGNTTVIGAWTDDHAGATDAGSAYVCDLSDYDLVPIPVGPGHGR